MASARTGFAVIRPALNGDEREELERLRAVTLLCCNKNGELRKDAERYRWLRNQKPIFRREGFFIGFKNEAGIVQATSDFADDQIDAEICRVIDTVKESK